MSDATFHWNERALRSIQDNFQKGILKWGFDVADGARDRAPYKTGALSNSIRVVEQREAVFVVAGGTFAGKTIAYARIQELGGFAGRNHAAHIAGKHYLRGSFEATVAGGLAKYFKGVV